MPHPEKLNEKCKTENENWKLKNKKQKWKTKNEKRKMKNEKWKTKDKFVPKIMLTDEDKREITSRIYKTIDVQYTLLLNTTIYYYKVQCVTT